MHLFTIVLLDYTSNGRIIIDNNPNKQSDSNTSTKVRNEASLERIGSSFEPQNGQHSSN